MCLAFASVQLHPTAAEILKSALCAQDLRQCSVPRIDSLFEEVSQYIQLHGLQPVIHARQRRMTYGALGRSCMRFHLDSDHILFSADLDPCG